MVHDGVPALYIVMLFSVEVVLIHRETVNEVSGDVTLVNIDNLSPGVLKYTSKSTKCMQAV